MKMLPLMVFKRSGFNWFMCFICGSSNAAAKMAVVEFVARSLFSGTYKYVYKYVYIYIYVTRVREKEDFVIVITLRERYEKIYENYYHSPHTQFQSFFLSIMGSCM